MVLILQFFLKKSKYEKDGSDFEKKNQWCGQKIPDVSGLVKIQISILKLLK